MSVPPTYRDRVRDEWGRLRLWDYLRYDEQGDLWINQLRVIDAVRAYGTPLEIADSTIVERRTREWRSLAEGIAREVGYEGRLNCLYAAKANMASESTHAAYRCGWHAETSAGQDLRHLEWLDEQGLLPADFRVVCNGFKLPIERLEPAPAATPSVTDPELLPPETHRHRRRNAHYVDAILRLARQGWRITPVLDAGELEAFAGAGRPEMEVGLRLKFGKVHSLWELEGHVSRFGQSLDDLRRTAEQVAASPNLTFTMLHAMTGAAETIAVESLVDSLLLAGRVWADLRQEHPSLRELNMGGGIPPLGEPYDHAAFLRRLLTGLKAIAEAEDVPQPELTFEFGSFVVAESGFHVFKVIQRKANHRDADHSEPDVPWAIIDGGLMAAIPDMLLIDRPFRFLAVTGANGPAGPVILGDVTCDSDGRYPPDDFPAGSEVWLPLAADGEEAYVLIQGVGAYQEILSGVRGAHHCGLLEAVELIIERGADGKLGGRLIPRQTPAEAARMLGYTAEGAEGLGRTVGIDSLNPRGEPKPRKPFMSHHGDLS